MGQRFEPSGENFEFVQGRSSLPRNPGVFTTPPLDPVAGDILVDQNGETTTLYVSVNQQTQPYARTGEFRPQAWVPIQASVGSDPVASYGVRLWEEDVAYSYSDLVLVSDGVGGFTQWLAIADHPADEAAPEIGASTGWALVGSTAGGGDSPVTEAPTEPPQLQAGFFWWDTDADDMPPPGGGATSIEYLYGGTVTGVDPGAGNLRISGTGNQPRTFAISETDADGERRNYGVLKAGDTLVITDDPDAPPVTGFARYLLITDPVDRGAWWSAEALRTDTAGVTTSPPIGTRLRVNAHLTDGGGGGGAGVVESNEPVPADLPPGSFWWNLDGAQSGLEARHGLLADLDADDHPQYLTTARGDARFARRPTFFNASAGLRAGAAAANDVLAEIIIPPASADRLVTAVQRASNLGVRHRIDFVGVTDAQTGQGWSYVIESAASGSTRVGMLPANTQGVVRTVAHAAGTVNQFAGDINFFGLSVSVWG